MIRLRSRSRLLIAAFGLLLVSALVYAREDRIHFRGGSLLAPDYRLFEEKDADISVALGHLVNRSLGLKISYSIFTEVVSAEPETLRRAGQTVISSRHFVSGGNSIVQSVAQDSLGQRRLYVSFPNAGPANFSVELSQDIEKAEKQRTEVEAVLSTFKSEIKYKVRPRTQGKT